MDPTDPRKQEGWNPNPSGKGGFGDNPDNRNGGRWKGEDSVSHQYNKFLRMTAEEVKEWETDYPEDKRTMAQELAYRAILRARKSLRDLVEVTDRTEGKAPQTIIHEGGLFSAQKLTIEEVKPDTMNTDETINKTETSTPTT